VVRWYTFFETQCTNINKQKQQFIHSVNGNKSKTPKIIKSDITHQHIANCQSFYNFCSFSPLPLTFGLNFCFYIYVQISFYPTMKNTAAKLTITDFAYNATTYCINLLCLCTPFKDELLTLFIFLCLYTTHS